MPLCERLLAFNSMQHSHPSLLIMKPQLFHVLLLATLLAACPASAQYHHGHGGYPSHTSPAYYPPVHTPSPQRPQPVRQPTQAQRDEALQRATEQRQVAVQATREREAQRAQERRQATTDALDQIAREARRMATSAEREPQDLNSQLARISQETSALRQQGLDCLVSQSGGMDCYRQPNMNTPVNFSGQQVIRVPEAYSGSLSGGGYNNPSLQHVRNNGPIPQGTWNAAGVRETLHGQPQSNVIVLESAPGNNRLGRDNDFLIHGDSRRNPGDASQGCVIAPPDVRQTLTNMLQSGGQVRLQVGR